MDAPTDMLADLIGRLDDGGRLIMRRALVEQGLRYGEQLLGEGAYPDERACLAAVAGWLARSDDSASVAAIQEALDLESVLVMYDAEGELVGSIWNIARATQAELAVAARYVCELAAEAGGWRSPDAARVDRHRGPRVAARRGRLAAERWQLEAVEAILAGQAPPPILALPAPLARQAEIDAYFRGMVDPQAAYNQGDRTLLRLLLSDEQVRAVERIAFGWAISCATLLLPPLEEDAGERACLGGTLEGATVSVNVLFLPLFRRIADVRAAATGGPAVLADAYAALLDAQLRRRQVDLALALAEGHPLDMESPVLHLTGRAVAYRQGEAGCLLNGLDAGDFLRLKLALTRQALWYAARLSLPEGQGHKECLAAVGRWLDNPATQVPGGLGPAPQNETLPARLVWNAVDAVASAAAAPDSRALLQAVGSAVRCSSAALNGRTATSAEAEADEYIARDYQLAVIWRIRRGEAPPAWVGPEQIYSPGSLQAAIRGMDEMRQATFCEQLLQLSNTVVERARRGMPAGARPNARDNMTDELQIARGLARRVYPTPAQRYSATSQVAHYCASAVRFAGRRIVENWHLGAVYAVVQGKEPPQLDLR